MLFRSFLDSPRFMTNAEDFFAIVRAVYGVRRKMIRGALRDLFPNENIEELLRSVDIDPTLRGEVLGFAQLDAIARSLTDFGQDRL